ncbi:hypothetical protein F3087_14700 [Nocardia colli]|uniref:Uncharacterized protein n=1 Tax=Nocardia colli TaxID=2545717 RepID=A0A5N0EH28_9NOCA|nr:hypothetical protein [Nocardia colli]KAA8888293.1 hypothetical protein F3087_14700 [Nocardia colli]
MFRTVFCACAAVAIGLGAAGVASAFNGQYFNGPNAYWDCSRQMDQDLTDNPGLQSVSCKSDGNGGYTVTFEQWK